MNLSNLNITNQQIVEARGPRHNVDPYKPYHVLVEKERQADGCLHEVLTVFLTNRECPFRCLMCDLWKNTTKTRVPEGAIPQQVQTALRTYPHPEYIKLYNSGNFFDRKAIPAVDRPKIARLLQSFRHVVLENHPKLCNDDVVKFRDQQNGSLEIAMGLETSHTATLNILNKQMTTADFAAACHFLIQNQIAVRSFVLVRPPNTTEVEGVQRAIDSVRFAFDCGVSCVAVIPTRSGNGIMDLLQSQGLFIPPTLRSVEQVMEETLSWKRGRVFADLWDLEQFSACSTCAKPRISRLAQMNESQQILPSIRCEECST